MITYQPLPTRNGTTLLEMVAAAAMLAMFLATSVQMMASIAAGDRTIDRRALAQRAVDNLAEQIQAMSTAKLKEFMQETDEMSPEELAQSQLFAHDFKRLPGAELSIADTPLTEPAAEQISLTLRWNNRNGQPARPLRLSIWAFPNEEESP